MNECGPPKHETRWTRRFLQFSVPMIVAVVLGTAVSLWWPRELTARGKSLSHWLEMAHSNPRDSWVDNSAIRTNAEQAIKEIGPAAVPALVLKVSEKEGLWVWAARRWNRNVVRHAPETWRLRLAVDASKMRRHRAEAREGFEILGTNAASAVPGLRELLRDDAIVLTAIACLKAVRTDDALSALIPMLTHAKPGVRAEALDAVLAFNERAILAREEIARLTDDANEETAKKATMVVGDLLPADRAIPLLLRKLNEPRPAIVRAAVWSFTFRGPKAEPVMPAIAEAFKSPERRTRELATNALQTINPYRAAEFGIDTNHMIALYQQTYHRTRERLATNTSPWRSW